MKRLVFILAILMSGAAYGQILQPNASSTIVDRWATKYGFRVPQVDSMPVARPNLNNYTGDSASGALVYCKCNYNTDLRGWYGWKVNRWYRIDSAYGGGGGLGVDDVYVRGGAAVDSFFYEKAGTEYFWYANPAEDRVISWSVTWTGTGLDYAVTAYYRLGGNYYSISNEIVTLPPLANPALSRKDLFIVDTSPAASSITGTEAVNPVTPPLDDPFTQLALTDITLNPGQTTGLTDTLPVYDNLSAGEFENRSGTGTTATFNNTTNVYRIPYAADIGALTNNDVIGFGTATPRDISSKLTLSFAIQLKGVMPNNKGMLVSLWNNGVMIGTEAGIPFNRSDLDYQLFSIPLSAFSLTSTTIDSVNFRFAGGGAAYVGLYMDWIYFQGNLSGGSGAYSGPWVISGVGINVDSVGRAYQPNADTTLLATRYYVDSSITASTTTGIYEVITATASQTVFNFTTVPTTSATYNIFINGSVCPKSYYSVAGNTVTFSTGLTLNDVVLIQGVQ
jgi:hypothetical protein